MEASTNNTANTTANVLVYEPVPPINPSNKEGQNSINPINHPGSLAEQSGPGLSTRQAQPIYALFDKYKSDAHQLLKEGKITEASEIYMSLAENLELKLKKRLNCAKRLLEINTQAPQTAQTKEYIVKAANILVDIAKDDRIHGPTRLKAFRSIAETKGLEDRALEIFSTFFKSQTLPGWIRDAAGDCVAPLLLAKAEDLQLWPLERIQAAEQLSQINGQVEKAAELLIAIAQDNNYHSVYRKKAAKLVSKLKGQEVQKRGKELLKAIKIEDLVRKSLSKDKKQANRCYAADYLSGRCYAAEKLSKIPGQETEASAAWTTIVNDTKPDPENDKIRLNDDIRLSYCIKAVERLAGMKAKESQALAIKTLEGIKQDITLKLSYRMQAAEVLSRITKGDELVDFLFTIVQDCVVLPFDRIESAERLSKLVSEDRQGEIWASLLNERHSYLDVDTGFKIAKKLSKIKKYEAIAANYFIYLGRYPCLFSDSVFTYKFIKACKHLAKIPGHEGIAAELLVKKSDLLIKRLKTSSTELIDLYGVAEALQEIPGQEENTARIWLTIIQHTANQQDLAYIAQSLLRIPGHAEKAKTVWLYIQDTEKEKLHQAFKSMYTILSAGGLFELGETEKAVRILTTCAQDETESPDRRMLAVDNLARIPSQEAEAERLKTNIEKVQANIANAIVAAKNHLQNSEEKEKEVNDLLSIAKNTAVDFLQRMLAIEALCEVPELHPKAIEALDFIAKDNTLFRDKHVLAAEKLSKIPGQAEKARKIADSHMIPISDESRYCKI